jgi:hypothetical protein
MKPTRVDRILEDWAAAANAARRPATPPRPVVVRTGLPMATLAGATAIVLAIAVAGVWLGRPTSEPSTGGSPSVPPQPSSSALTAAATTEPTTEPSTAPTTAPSTVPTPNPTPRPTIGPCGLDSLAAHITLWEGAAGSRIAHVQLAVVRGGPCDVATMPTPQLVDRHGVVLIQGTQPPAGPNLTMTAGNVASTMVEVGDYCGPTPAFPLSVAFVFGDGLRIVATPVSADDTTVPPCNSSPGAPGTIDMHPWAR